MGALYRVITRTYLEMRQRSEFSPVQNGDARIRIEKIGNCPTSFFRYLYREVGRNYDWVDCYRGPLKKRGPWEHQESGCTPVLLMTQLQCPIT